MMEYLAALEGSAFSTWLRESTSIWAYPTVLTLHTVGLAVLVGANWALDLIGHDGLLKASVADAPMGGRFERSYRYTVTDTIGGGTSEVQKNIIARRGLGLPQSY